MERIVVGRYKHPETHGWAGWVMPDDQQANAEGFYGPPSWALFITTDGHVSLGIRTEQDELLFSDTRGPNHPQTWSLVPGDPEP